MGFFDGAFGLSSTGKQYQNNINGGLKDLDNKSTAWGNQAATDANSAQALQGDIYNNNNNIIQNGIGDSRSLNQAGKNIVGDTNDNYQSQQDRLEAAKAATAGYRNQQNTNNTNNWGFQNDLAGGAFGKATGETNAATGNMETLNNGVSGDLTGKSTDAYGTANSRLTGAMDANGAAAMRATAPLEASTKANLRASGIDPNSPEGISALQNVNRSRAEALDNNLSSNIAAQNQNTLGEMQNNQGIKQNQLQTNLGLENNQLNQNRADTYENYNADANNATVANQEAQGILNSQANDQNQYANQENTVGQNQVQQGDVAGQTGLGYGSQNTSAEQNANNSNSGVYNTLQGAAQGWGNLSLGARNSNLGINQSLYNQQANNAGWLGKGLIGAGLGVASAFAKPSGG